MEFRLFQFSGPFKGLLRVGHVLERAQASMSWNVKSGFCKYMTI